MKCFYYFKCSFGDDLENPIFNEYCGPVIKETKDGFFIENHANNYKIFPQAFFSKIAGLYIFDSPQDVTNAKNLIPYCTSNVFEENERIYEYSLGFFFEDNEGIVKHIAAKLCKEACMKSYKNQIEYKIETLKSNLDYCDILTDKLIEYK